MKFLINRTAILVGLDNVKQLTDGILKLVMDLSLQKELGENARKEVLEKYTWDKNIGNLLFFIGKKLVRS